MFGFEVWRESSWVVGALDSQCTQNNKNQQSSDQCCGSVFIESRSGSSISSESGSGFGSKVLMTQNWKKNLGENFFISVLDQKCNLRVPRSRTSKLHEKPSALNREHSALEKMKFISLFLWVIFALPTTLPPTQWNLRDDTQSSVGYGIVPESTRKKWRF